MTDRTEHELGRLFASRARWFRLDLVQNRDGGWDVMLRLDGSYASREWAEPLLGYFREQLDEALGLPTRSDDGGGGDAA
jgi:hypothetical protein